MSSNNATFSNYAFKEENEQIYANVPIKHFKKAKEKPSSSSSVHHNELIYENFPVRQPTPTIDVQVRPAESVAQINEIASSKCSPLEILKCIGTNWRLLVACLCPLLLLPIPIAFPGPVCALLQLL